MKAKCILKHTAMVWCNEKMDKLRSKECLCLNCRVMENCDWASELYGMCKISNLALAVTRCPDWVKQ